MKQIVTYHVKNLVTNNSTSYDNLDEAKKKAQNLRLLGIGALVFRKTSSLYGDNTIIMDV